MRHMHILEVLLPQVGLGSIGDMPHFSNAQLAKAAVAIIDGKPRDTAIQKHYTDCKGCGLQLTGAVLLLETIDELSVQETRRLEKQGTLDSVLKERVEEKFHKHFH